MITPINHTDERGTWRYYPASVADSEGAYDIYLPAVSLEHAAARLADLQTSAVVLGDGPIVASQDLRPARFETSVKNLFTLKREPTADDVIKIMRRLWQAN